jgi:glycosyltransferase involved in cell wall biosynthesis
MSSFRKIPPPVSMRINNNALWINRHADGVRCEIYRPDRRYDVVVFFKAMDEPCQLEAQRVKAYGGKVIFDANVNYYEIWGEYDIPETEPTPVQQQEAITMTRLADWVVADSSYLLGVVEKVNDRASWIPDNVDTRLYRPGRAARDRRPVRLVWSGVGKKAQPLVTILDVLASLRGIELVLVTDTVPDVLPELAAVLPCRVVSFSDRRYARTLRGCDVIIAPKRLVNGYELGHTEYKITLGMASGLPAVASPQQSYVEAISDRGGGTICDTESEWRDALERLVADASLRERLGTAARQTVLERYATPVTARLYLDLLLSLR